MSHHLFIVDGRESRINDEELLDYVRRPDAIVPWGVWQHTGSTLQRMGGPTITELTSWQCAYCRTVSAWRAGDRPIAKCGSCGAPRGFGT